MKKSLNKHYPSQDPIRKLERELKIRGFSQQTIKSYFYYNTQFLNFTRKNPRQIKNQDIKRYLEFLIDKKVSHSTLSLAINALKYYYKHILKRRFFIDIKHPKKDKKLPVVLSKKEIKLILNSISNQKHQLILALIYGSGLRISEAVNLKVKDLDFENNALWIRQSKGNKDRQSFIPDKIKPYLIKFVQDKKINDFLFTNRQKNKLNVRSIQKIFTNALKKSGIKKPASCHSLRHSFATHLLEQGTNIRYIQELLGHRRLETTQIYTKVASNKLKDIANPLDKL